MTHKRKVGQPSGGVTEHAQAVESSLAGPGRAYSNVHSNVHSHSSVPSNVCSNGRSNAIAAMDHAACGEDHAAASRVQCQQQDDDGMLFVPTPVAMSDRSNGSGSLEAMLEFGYDFADDLPPPPGACDAGEEGPTCVVEGVTQVGGYKCLAMEDAGEDPGCGSHYPSGDVSEWAWSATSSSAMMSSAETCMYSPAVVSATRMAAAGSSQPDRGSQLSTQNIQQVGRGHYQVGGMLASGDMRMLAAHNTAYEVVTSAEDEPCRMMMDGDIAHFNELAPFW
eukprot:2990275-Pyramimonas_sp.AAC.1